MSRFRVLGPVEVWADERPLVLGGPQQVALLAFLLLHADRAVSADAVIDALWGAERAGAAHRLHMAVSRLRRSLQPLDGQDGPRLRAVSGGYLLSVRPDELDAEVFASGVRDGRHALEHGDPARASELLGDALGLWRGPPLAEVAFEDFAQAAIRRLDELRLSAVETKTEADLQLGRHAEVIAELDALLGEEPTRERLAGQLMTALYRSGRQADALEVYQRTRALFAEELGLEPGPALKRLQAEILDQAASLEHSSAGDLPAHSRRPSHQRVPWPATPIIGRDSELEEVTRLVAMSGVRLLTLTGPGGVGKTRIAIAVAHKVEPEFANGVCWVELAGVARAADVPPAIVRALAATPLQGESTTDTLRRNLAGKQLLLVLDNFEHVLEASSLVARLLSACPELVVLATSREALNIAPEQQHSVAPLELPAQPELATVADVESAAATAMFVHAARRRDSRFTISPITAPEIARVGARLDGLPLALELAAARVAPLGLVELARRLDVAISDPSSAPRDAPDRQKTLSATVEWSYRLLDENERRCFARLALFAGGASLDTAQAVTGATIAALQGLVAKSLVVRRDNANGHTRLVMLRTIRDYALARFDEDPQERDVRFRHLDYFTRFVTQTVPKLSTHEESNALRLLDLELENIYVALAWALDAAPAAALKLAGYLGDYWDLRRNAGGLDWLEATLSRANDAPPDDRARAKLGLIYLLFLRGRYDEARSAAAEALELYRAIGDEAGMAAALRELAGYEAVVTGDKEEARAYAEASCRHARIAGDDILLGRSLAWLAPGLEGAEQNEVLQEAANLLSRVGHNSELANMYTGAAYRALIENRPHDALSLLRLALPVAEQLATVSSKMIVLGNIGLANLLLGNLSAAQAAFEAQLQLCFDQSFRAGPDEALAGLAAVSVREGQFERAGRLLGAARAKGFPITPAGQPICDRLELDFFAPARSRYGFEAWRRAEKAGADLSYGEAVAYAMAEREPR